MGPVGLSLLTRGWDGCYLDKFRLPPKNKLLAPQMFYIRLVMSLIFLLAEALCPVSLNVM